MKKECSNCRWVRKLPWNDLSGRWYVTGDCKRHAPIVIDGRGRHYEGMPIWPKMRLDDLCGDHEPRTPEQVSEDDELLEKSRYGAGWKRENGKILQLYRKPGTEEIEIVRIDKELPQRA